MHQVSQEYIDSLYDVIIKIFRRGEMEVLELLIVDDPHEGAGQGWNNIETLEIMIRNFTSRELWDDANYVRHMLAKLVLRADCSVDAQGPSGADLLPPPIGTLFYLDFVYQKYDAPCIEIKYEQLKFEDDSYIQQDTGHETTASYEGGPSRSAN